MSTPTPVQTLTREQFASLLLEVHENALNLTSYMSSTSAEMEAFWPMAERECAPEVYEYDAGGTTFRLYIDMAGAEALLTFDHQG